MSGRVFTALAGVALLLLAATPGLWLACGPRGQHWIYTFDSRGAGGVVTQHNLDLTLSGGLAFGWYANDWKTWSYRQLTVPWWAVGAAAAILPAIWSVRLRRRAVMMASRTHCRRCGYDLRATPDRCPECGDIVPKHASAVMPGHSSGVR